MTVRSLKDSNLAVVVTNKGQELKERMTTNFGSPLPQGYRKAL
ncbi:MULTISPECIES: hypothetical protein [unclassified Lactobacillus]|nr:hypothetical protein F5ESL0247_06765 [Lactobacillus sp. ESL0247]RMC27512.1 hypothetical protein F5ESL0246_06765 [Lactobacillus sp. ESL0246]RMC30712.1 hypothetical protein F5ESL0245_06765 [Lactobacillus sp. ESL0245]